MPKDFEKLLFSSQVRHAFSKSAPEISFQVHRQQLRATFRIPLRGTD